MAAAVSSSDLTIVRGGSEVQCTASTSAFAGYRGTVDAEAAAICAANDAAVGVVGEEADALEEDMARRWVGKSLLSGGFDDGMMGTSRNGGR